MTTPSLQELMALPADYLAEVNPSSKTMYNTAIAFIVIDTILFALFIASTRMTRHGYAIELYLIMPLAFLGVIGDALIGILLVDMGGVGRHIAYHMLNNPHTIKTYLQLQTGVELIYMASVVFPKIAILTLYLRVFVDRTARALTWAMVATMVSFFIGGLILGLALCRPYAYKWDKTIHGHCGDIMAGYRWVSVPSIVTDLFILIIPIPSIWRLQLNRGKKIGVFLTFLVGGLGFITAIMRYVTFWHSDLMADPTYLAGKTMTWTIVESSAYFCCACMARLRPVSVWFLDKTIIGNTVSTTFRSLLNNSKGTRASSVGDFRKVGSGGRRASNANSSDDDSKLVRANVMPLDSLHHLEHSN